MRVLRGYSLNKVTRDALAKTLEGFALTLEPGRDLDWLAMAVRRALSISMREESDGPQRTSNTDIRKELERLAELAGSTWRELFECKHSVDYRLWTIAWRHWDGEDGNVSEPADYRRFKAAVGELDWLTRFLRQAARETESPRGSWRSKERKWLRIERGQFLAPIFEAAFGQPVSANNFPNDARHKAPTAFMDFYQRMVALAFGEQATADLSGVLKAACQLHRKHPLQFDEGIIPGL